MALKFLIQIQQRKKIVMKKFALWFCWENLVWSANVERPLSP